MATIPDAMDLGSRVIPQNNAPLTDDRSALIAAEGVVRTAQSIGNTAKEFAREHDQFNYSRAKAALLSSDTAMRKALEGDQEWQTHESRYTEKMKLAREDASKMIVGARAKALFDQEAQADIERGTTQIRGQARHLEGQWGRSELDSTLDTNRRAALETKDEASRSELIRVSQHAIEGARAKGYITPEQAVQVRQAWTANYGEGFVEMQTPAEQMRLLKAPKGTPADFIDPAKRSQMLERLTEKQRIAVDRREARAERAVASIERQIASGVPATAQMWKDWKETIAGTSMQGELTTLLKGEAEVQKTLRMPIADQVRIVQEKESSLAQTGGSLADAANINRLKTAVQQNVALIRGAPLLFAEKRLDADIEPLDMAAIGEPSRESEVATILQDRAVQIKAVEKSFGGSVPMLPLLPQEAAQFSAALNGSSPKEAAQIVAALRNASGSQDVFQGVMHQLAGDSPVTALAGMLSAKQRSAEINGAAVPSRDVAATILAGERILNPSKGAKAQDGKPQTKNLYLPDPNALQAEFQDVVGDAFAGRDDAASVALQSVRAYYAGRAAETGRIASDDQDVDSDLVAEAVQATMGAVVNYNDNGSVLAPWGMSEDDFEDRVERAFTARAKELKIGDTDALGLTNGNKDGEYAITIGRNLLLDRAGKPVTINLAPNDPRDAKGFIVR
jgi:hypothetical protein